jgi:hypothetical protein
VGLAEWISDLLAKGSLIYMIAIIVCVGIAHGFRAVFFIFYRVFQRRTVNEALSHDRRKFEKMLREFSSLSRSTDEQISSSITACEFLIKHLPDDIVNINVKQHLTSSFKPNVTRMAKIVMEVIADTQGGKGKGFKYLTQLTLSAITELGKDDVDYHKLQRRLQ